MSITEQPAQEQAPQVTVEDVQAQYPELVIWAGYSGTLYAAPRAEGPWPLPGDTPAELAAQIAAAKERMGDRWPKPPAAAPGP